MPRHTSAAVAYRLAAMSVCLTAAGCAPPVVKVHHSLPAALPLPARTESLRVGKVTVWPIEAEFDDEATSDWGIVPILLERLKLMEARLEKALEAKDWIRPRQDDTPFAAGECAIYGTIHFAIRDRRGKRNVLLLDPATKATRPVEVPTLVRRAKVRVEFSLLPAGADQDLGIIEVERTYDSALDPAVRGELGLDRPDDPNRVPPVETILYGLLDQCAGAFKRMITPTPVDAELQLRPIKGADTRKAFAAADKADWPQALAEFQNALNAAPDDPDRNFNLAVAAEVAGLLDQAAAGYQRAFDLSGEMDDEAYDGARRCRKVLEARRRPQMPARPTRW